MSYNIEKTNLIEGILEQIDKSPRFPLGSKIRDADGREYVYVKAIKNLTAGVPVLGVARTALTVGSVSDRCFIITSTTPTLATDDFDANEIKGTLVKITSAGGELRGVYPITNATYDGSKYIATCPEVKAGDTVVFANGAQVVAAGGVSSTEGGATNVTPVADIPSGSFTFVVPETVGDGTGSESGAHNSTFRGRDLTSLYTLDELSAKVRAGDFSNIFVGDYITKTVKVGNNAEREEDFVVAGIDYWYGVGDQGNGLTTHHLLMIPKWGFYETAQMNGTNTTTGGYYGSGMHGIASPAYTAGSGGALTNVVADYETFLHTTLGANDGTYTFERNASNQWTLDGNAVGSSLTAYGVTYSGTPVAGDKIVLTFAKGNLEPFRKAIYDAFGESHILTHRSYMTTSDSAGQWHNARVELMNECMVYGSKIYANNSEGERAAPIQLPYFQNEPQMRMAHRGKGGQRNTSWLSSIYSASDFCGITGGGNSTNASATTSLAVRPYFLFA